MELKKRAQGTIEFILIFGAILFFFIAFFSIIQRNISNQNEDKEKILLQSIALDVRDEINMAAESSDGYSRNFTLPENILGKDYEINISDNFVYVSTEKNGFVYRISQVSGSIQKGINRIIKQNGMVTLLN